MSWSLLTPDGTEDASNGDDRIRELKTDMEGALQAQDPDEESVFPGSDVAAPIYRYRGLKGATAARPAAGEYGLFVDTTRNALQRDNGTSWDDIGTLIPAGTVMVFYQAAAPVGWTKVITQDDKVLRVVSSDGGGAGGTDSIATPPTHIHATVSHTLTIPEMPAHTHTYIQTSTSAIGGAGPQGYPIVSSQPSGNTGSTGGGGGHDHGDVSAVTGFSPAYIDVLIASKD